MKYKEPIQDWKKKGGSLSDKTAIKEFGLTQNDIINAIKKGKLQFREGSVYGNPFFRLLRPEVEKLVEDKFGKKFLIASKANTELKIINTELKKLKLKADQLEKQKKNLILILKKGPLVTLTTASKSKKT